MCNMLGKSSTFWPLKYDLGTLSMSFLFLVLTPRETWFIAWCIVTGPLSRLVLYSLLKFPAICFPWHALDSKFWKWRGFPKFESSTYSFHWIMLSCQRKKRREVLYVCANYVDMPVSKPSDSMVSAWVKIKKSSTYPCPRLLLLWRLCQSEIIRKQSHLFRVCKFLLIMVSPLPRVQGRRRRSSDRWDHLGCRRSSLMKRILFGFFHLDFEESIVASWPGLLSRR